MKNGCVSAVMEAVKSDLEAPSRVRVSGGATYFTYSLSRGITFSNYSLRNLGDEMDDVQLLAMVGR